MIMCPVTITSCTYPLHLFHLFDLHTLSSSCFLSGYNLCKWMVLQLFWRNKVTSFQFTLPSAICFHSISHNRDVIIMSGISHLDTSPHQFVNLIVHNSCCGFCHRHFLTIERGHLFHAHRMVN